MSKEVLLSICVLYGVVCVALRLSVYGVVSNVTVSQPRISIPLLRFRVRQLFVLVPCQWQDQHQATREE